MLRTKPLLKETTKKTIVENKDIATCFSSHDIDMNVLDRLHTNFAMEP